MTPPHPNVLLLHCHDLGRFLGCYGVDTVSTPNLERLATEGVRFDRAFCTAPQCSPSRSSLFTGRWPHNTGVMGLTHHNFAWDMNPDERHMARVFRDAGYVTTMLGVHHESRMGLPDDEVAAKLGFDEVVTGGGPGERIAERAADRLARLAQEERPFFLDVGFFEPHRMRGSDEDGYMGFLGRHISPDRERGVTVPPYLVDDAPAREEVAELQGAVRYMDDAVGRVLRGLEESGVADDTIVVFTTDHGLALPRAKCSLYDPGLEVALIVRWPGRGWRGDRQATVSNLDVLPTVLDCAGLAPEPRVQGRSFLRVLEGTDQHREEIFAEMTYHDYYDPRRCIRTDAYKLIVNFSSAHPFMDPTQSWRRRTMPRVGMRDSHPVCELYDLTDDPLESVDLADNEAHAGVRDQLMARLLAWMASTSDPLLDGAVTSPLHERAVASLRQHRSEAPR